MNNGWEHRAVHQIYGMMQHRATFEGHMVRDPNSRPFVLSQHFSPVHKDGELYGLVIMVLNGVI